MRERRRMQVATKDRWYSWRRKKVSLSKPYILIYLKHASASGNTQSKKRETKSCLELITIFLLQLCMTKLLEKNKAWFRLENKICVKENIFKWFNICSISRVSTMPLKASDNTSQPYHTKKGSAKLTLWDSQSGKYNISLELFLVLQKQLLMKSQICFWKTHHSFHKLSFQVHQFPGRDGCLWPASGANKSGR